ncbi:MAG: hypothetical protein RID53_09760 [Coleofasciculus sp. B1-GNL1-01]
MVRESQLGCSAIAHPGKTTDKRAFGDYCREKTSTPPELFPLDIGGE